MELDITSPSLMGLPTELRLTIFDHYFSHVENRAWIDGRLGIDTTNYPQIQIDSGIHRARNLSSALFLVSKQIATDAKAAFVLNLIFMVYSGSHKHKHRRLDKIPAGLTKSVQFIHIRHLWQALKNASGMIERHRQVPRDLLEGTVSVLAQHLNLSQYENLKFLNIWYDAAHLELSLGNPMMCKWITGWGHSDPNFLPEQGFKIMNGDFDNEIIGAASSKILSESSDRFDPLLPIANRNFEVRFNIFLEYGPILYPQNQRTRSILYWSYEKQKIIPRSDGTFFNFKT